MRLRYRNQPAQTLATDRADHSFADRIGLRRPRWGFQHTYAQRLDRFVQVLSEDPVSIVKLVSIGTVHTDNFSPLLQGPVRARVGRNIDAHQSPASMLNDHKHVEHSESRGDSNEKVARQNRFCMVLQECGPALVASWLPNWQLRHVLPHRPRRNSNAQFHQQFTGNPLFTPKRILLRHPADQCA